MLNSKIINQNEQCAYLGCNKHGEVLDDVEIAPGVVEKRLVCKEHKGQLVGNIQVISNFMLDERMLQDLPEVKVLIGKKIAPDEIKNGM